VRPVPDRLIIDGYNVIYASEELEALLQDDVEAAREKLLSEIEEYCSREGRSAIVVFDAAGRKGPATLEERTGFIQVAYTAGGQSADSYIEKLAYRGGGADSVLLVTGDYDQQKVAVSAGLLRMSSREFLLAMRESRDEAIQEARGGGPRSPKVSVAERLPEKTREALERFKQQH
jgi:predicted RNA-binding protein with PIN domain